MSEEKPPSSPTSASRIPRPITTKPRLTPSSAPVTPGPPLPADDSESKAASVPPPPPSRRPLSERPVTLGTSPLPPPVSVRPSLPRPPPVARVFKQEPTETDLKRDKDENQELRDKLAAQREETRVEQKNVERLRSELAHLKTKMAAQRPSSSMISRSELERARADHLQEIRLLKSKQQSEVDNLSRQHRVEITRLKTEHQTTLSDRDKKALAREKQELSHVGGELEEMRKELADLREKNAALRQRNSELETAQEELERRLRTAEEQALAAPAEVETSADDLTELKGVGPKVALALRAAGITSFAQIASWTDSDIEEIAPKIKTAVGRIRNNEWVAQAQRRTR